MEITATDGYKFSMAQAGFPIREEIFYFSFRKGGPQYIPFDLEDHIQFPIIEDYSLLKYLSSVGYELTQPMIEAIRSKVKITSAPKGTWVCEREPILTVKGPSFLVSWLEPTIIQLQYPIQLASSIMKEEVIWVTCEEQKKIVENICSSLRVNKEIKINSKYKDTIQNKVKDLIGIVKDPSRIFEVGMRSASCMQEHQICLEILRENGVKSTSNVSLAKKLDMKPIGTMGHEHVQRWGDDLNSFRAMRDMKLGTPSYLLDTYDTYSSGIPSALQVAKEKSHRFSIRYDSGDKYSQYMMAHGLFSRNNLEPIHIIEDGLNLNQTVKFEKLREITQISKNNQVYGYGNYFVALSNELNPYTRDNVSAVYKLCSSSKEPKMKFGNDEGLGKQSIPGDPVIWRRLRGNGPSGIIGQKDERVEDNYVLLSGNPESIRYIQVANINKGVLSQRYKYTLSNETKEIVNKLRKENINASNKL